MNSKRVLTLQAIPLAAALLVTLTSPIFTGTASALEQPDYEVLYHDDDVEYRRYAGYVVAETEVASVADYNAAANAGFRRLFDYISGANNRQGKIAMTAPVQQAPRDVAGDRIAMTAPVQQSATTGGWRVAFMLPGEYTLGDAPQPNDARVYLRTVPPRLMAVWRYAGRWTQKNFEKHQALLLTRLQADGVTVLSQPESAVYNPPFMPPFMRRNEIMVQVDGLPPAPATE